MPRALIIFLGLLVPRLTACTTITIEEASAFDRKRTVDLDGLRSRGVRVATTRLAAEDGVELDVWRLVPPKPRGTVLHFGGNGFLMVTAHDVVEALLSLNMAVVMCDYRGYGRSDGEPSVAAIKADALRLYDHVTTDLEVSADRLVVHGHSMGSLVATWVASRRPVAALVLESPLTDVEDLLDRMTPWLADMFISFRIDPALAAERNGPRLAKVRAPILMLVGADDPVTPQAMAEDLHRHAPVGARLVVIADRSHNDLPPTAVYRAEYESLVTSTLGSAPDTVVE